jgi:hypothetical protein
MVPHYPIVVLSAVKSCLLTFVRSEEFMIGDTGGESEPLANFGTAKNAIEVNPFPAVLAPDLTARYLREPGGQQRLFQPSQMFAGHCNGLPCFIRHDE